MPARQDRAGHGIIAQPTPTALTNATNRSCRTEVQRSNPGPISRDRSRNHVEVAHSDYHVPVTSPEDSLNVYRQNPQMFEDGTRELKVEG